MFILLPSAPHRTCGKVWCPGARTERLFTLCFGLGTVPRLLTTSGYISRQERGRDSLSIICRFCSGVNVFSIMWTSIRGISSSSVQLPAVTLSFNLPANVALGEAV
jgi:sulfite exporter TauE/SafE